MKESENPTPKSPDISVLIPAFQCSKTIVRAVRSTLAAMPPNSELLVGLDGHDDGIMNALGTVSDSRLNVFVFTRSGVAGTLNQLLGRASGRYVARMDGDDVCLPWRFQLQLQTARKRNTDFLFSNAVYLGRFRLYCQLPELGGRGLLKKLLRGNVLIHPTAFIKRSALLELGGYESVPAEDYVLWLKAANAGFSFFRSSIPTIIYRLHAGQVSRSKAWIGQLSKDTRIKSLTEELRGKINSMP